MEGTTVLPGLGVGSASVRAASPPVFGRMSEEHAHQAAKIYTFDLLAQNPDRRMKNANCFEANGQLYAIDFEACFSFLLPIIGAPPAWQATRLGIHAGHVFHPHLSVGGADWPSVFGDLGVFRAGDLRELTWLLPEWIRYAGTVADHLLIVMEHRKEFEFEVLRSLS
jgi:hypothetical protein